MGECSVDSLNNVVHFRDRMHPLSIPYSDIPHVGNKILPTNTFFSGKHGYSPKHYSGEGTVCLLRSFAKCFQGFGEFVVIYAPHFDLGSWRWRSRSRLLITPRRVP